MTPFCTLELISKLQTANTRLKEIDEVKSLNAKVGHIFMKFRQLKYFRNAR